MTLRELIRSTGLLLCREEYASADPVRALALRAYAAGIARGRGEAATGCVNCGCHCMPEPERAPTLDDEVGQ